MNIETALGVESLRTAAKAEQVEDRIDVAVETIFTLAGKNARTITEALYALLGVTIESSTCRNPILGQVVPVVILIVERRSNTLIIWRNHYVAAKHGSSAALTTVNTSDGVGLSQVLGVVANILHDSSIRLEYGISSLEVGGELELVADSRSASGEVVTQREVNLIHHVVVEVVLIGSDAGLLMRVNCKSGAQELVRSLTGKKSINVSGVRSRIESDEGCVHMT